MRIQKYLRPHVAYTNRIRPSTRIRFVSGHLKGLVNRACALRLVLILWRQRIQKYTDTSVHTYPDTQRIQKFPLRRAYTEISGYTERIRRTRVDARCIRIKKLADTKISGYVWTGPQSLWRLFLHTYFVKCRQTLLNLNSKGPYPSSEREIKFLRCLLTFSIKREIWHFHAVVVQKRQRNHGTKKCTSRAKLLFCLLKQLFFWRPRCCARRWILKSLIRACASTIGSPLSLKLTQLGGWPCYSIRVTFLHINGAIISLQVIHNTIKWRINCLSIKVETFCNMRNTLWFTLRFGVTAHVPSPPLIQHFAPSKNLVSMSVLK